MLLWETFSLGYKPYPGCTNQEVLDFVSKGDRRTLPGAVQACVSMECCLGWEVFHSHGQA